MAPQNLGVQPLNLDYAWAAFNPITLVAGQTYSLGVRQVAANPSQLYSFLKLRAKFDTSDGANFFQQFDKNIEYTSGLQIVEFKISDNLNLVGDVVLEIQRYPLFLSPSGSSALDVRLFLDPARSY